MNEKTITIQLELTVKEATRLADMSDHIAEEAHDDANKSEPWYLEEWWTALADNIRDQLRYAGVTDDVIQGYE